MGREHRTALLIDLDGVLRTWDPEVRAATEERYGLPPGALLKTAMDRPLLRPAITGEIDHAEWMERVAAALGAQTGDPAAARAAVKEWEADRGTVDADVLGFIRDVRAAGLPVALTTNATDRLDADLAALGISGEVDAVINSSELGVPKPAREYFAAACAAIGASPSGVLFVDDSDRCVRGARVAGLSAYRWNGPDDLPYLRSALGLTG